MSKSSLKSTLAVSLNNYLDAGAIVAGGSGITLWQSYLGLSEMHLGWLNALSANALDRVHYGLDFFDGSINRIGAYVIGSRAAQKCMLRALLEPRKMISELELAGEGYKVLALIEEQKAMPWQAVYDEFCVRNNVPVGQDFILDIEKYTSEVISKR